jgi:hypothetical protein
MLPFLAGLVVGGGVVAAAGLTYVQRERAIAQKAIADAATIGQANRAVQDFVSGTLSLAGGGPAGSAPAASDADKVKALGDESVEDLRQSRLLAVYKLTTADYKNRVKREEFDKMMAEVSNVRHIFPIAQQRESKVRKATDGDGFEYYCSSGGNGFTGNVVFAFVFVPGDNNTWRIGQLEVNYANR